MASACHACGEVIKLALDLQEKRTGKRPLPFGVTEVLDGGYVNPEGDDF